MKLFEKQKMFVHPFQRDRWDMCVDRWDRIEGQMGQYIFFVFATDHNNIGPTDLICCMQAHCDIERAKKHFFLEILKIVVFRANFSFPLYILCMSHVSFTKKFPVPSIPKLTLTTLTYYLMLYGLFRKHLWAPNES